MRYLLIAAALYGLWKLVRRVDRWLTEPHTLAQHARDYEWRQRRQRGMEHGYEWEG
uniref:Uncharacterized protein n=1 Tax=viral metagenome TaxID=1070528 RepID=A0A6M3J6W1_9ZZZZ